MKVLIDTSVWIDFFNGYPSKEAEMLERLIKEEAELLTCGVIVAEFMQGIRDRKSLSTLERHFRDMDWLTPREPETYLEAAKLFRELRSRGATVRSTIDCLIAQVAAESDALILAKDRDIMAIVDSRILKLKTLPLPA